LLKGQVGFLADQISCESGFRDAFRGRVGLDNFGGGGSFAKLLAKLAVGSQRSENCGKDYNGCREKGGSDLLGFSILRLITPIDQRTSVFVDSTIHFAAVFTWVAREQR